MARVDGFYKVKHHGKEKIMLWTATNKDNTESISGFWKGHNGYSGNDHDMDFIDEKCIPYSIILNILNENKI